ncbi:MAG: M56 family metallopeptidase, partial [Candidatus Latescibacteria bacterium]|nr:M56 family metallopeptidase [Candidatus Latescibacterota bacterium]
LDTRLRYSLWLLALAKAFVPPFYAVPIPEFLIAAPESVAAVAVGKSLYLSANLETDFVASVPVSTPIPMAFYLFCLWAVSALVLAGATLWKNATFQSALGVALPVNLTGKIENLAGAEGLEVFAKANLNSPLLVGLVKPRLYLPSQWSSWSPEQLRGVVAHELAHHRNRDIWALIFQALAIALFGVNPLIWLANKNLTHLRELRCDEAVLRETDLTPAEYGRLLFGFVDATGRPVLNALYFNERGTSLKERFEHVLNFKRGTMKRSKWQLAIPILVGLAIVPLSIREAYTQAPESVQPIVSIRDTEVRPKLESAVGPLYPSELRNAGVEGDVLMGFVVDPGGQVRDIRLLEGRAQFERAATDALKQFKFEPLLNGQPIQMTQAIRFSLPKENSEDYAMPETLRSKSYLGPIVVIGHVGDKLSYRMSIPEHAQSDPQGTPVKINASNVLKFRIGKPEQDGQRRAQREEPKFQVAHGSPEVEKVAHIWINNLGELLVNKEKQIKATDLARELQRLKAVQGIEEVQI